MAVIRYNKRHIPVNSAPEGEICIRRINILKIAVINEKLKGAAGADIWSQVGYERAVTALMGIDNITVYGNLCNGICSFKTLPFKGASSFV